MQFSSVAQSSPTLCDPMDCSTPGFPVHHQLPEFAFSFFFKHRTFSDPKVRKPFYKMSREELKGSEPWAKLNVSSLKSVATITPN